MGARSESKAEIAIADIKREIPNANICFLRLDLSSFASIKQAATLFLSANERLDLLLNNAGIFAVPPALTEDGYEIQFGTNHMGPALLTKLLMPLLLKTAAQPRSDVRIVNISSTAYTSAPKPGLLLSQNKTTLPDLGIVGRYGQSKLANIYFTQELAERYPSILSVALHPGVVKTGIADGPNDQPLFTWFFRLVGKVAFVDVATGALNQLWASAAPRDDIKSGAMYFPVGKEHTGNAMMRDRRQVEELWKWTEDEFKKHGY
ncbi:Short-chain dehydrogenase/reductase SDR [Neofusicoccum parvum]|uniref:Putative short-chain dehydrogenase reductase sdr protein n=1 Tax=Botryosphaeria parva (strain UCR-NP2) TaxID=1287680 RepID=R1EQX9_BOTPV|nr:putative short-chain dehydrogenase reductase sdr protein [Neofusicoccum parvum UCRNP2]GME52250.1 Short-chain dehydrogenase/reductase SDR [Neofusicoccum parvum]